MARFLITGSAEQVALLKIRLAFGMSVWSVPVYHEDGTREYQKDCSCYTCPTQFPAIYEKPAVLQYPDVVDYE